jgi:hypothetical protein
VIGFRFSDGTAVAVKPNDSALLVSNGRRRRRTRAISPRRKMCSVNGDQPPMASSALTWTWHTGGMEEEVHPVVKAAMGVLMLGIVLLSGWCTVVAFAGGTIPIVGMKLHGGAGSGIAWLVFADPIVITVGYWLCLIVVLPLGAIFRSR